VAIIKHDGHDFEMDKPGKDTWRYAQAGADAVCIASAYKMALLRTWNKEPSLHELLLMLPETDLVFVEGYKREGIHKIAVLREANGLELPCPLEELAAIVSDVEFECNIPHFPLHDITPMLAYLMKHCLGKSGIVANGVSQ